VLSVPFLAMYFVKSKRAKPDPEAHGLPVAHGLRMWHNHIMYSDKEVPEPEKERREGLPL